MIQQKIDLGEMLMHHTADSYALDFEPFFTLSWEKWPDLHIGSFAVNLTPTKHVVFLAVASLLVFLVMKLAGRSLEKQRAHENAPRGFANAIEALALWVRNEVAIAHIGQEMGPVYAPYIMSLFFFLLFANLLGLLPWGATATGNVAVTGGMAIISMLVIEIGGMYKLGAKGYMRTIFLDIPGMSGPTGTIISIAMAPIEILGKLIKPFALCIRLFGNMTAGHFVILSLIGLIFLFAPIGVWNWGIAAGSVTLVLGIMTLEIIVAFVQAYVFTLITAVLIGLMQHEH